ncbi:MAG: cellulase family glycosylhydrolase [Polyangiaceae bacterium]
MSRAPASALALVTTLALTFTIGACDEDPPATQPTDALTAEGGVLRDAEGRELLLRGINARVEGIFDVTFDDGRVALEPIPPFDEQDCKFIAEELGMNHLRLPVNWSALEPERGHYDDAQVDKILAVAEACARHDVHTLIDLHQDAYSKEIGEDGAPLWAIVPPPTELLEGPLEDLGERRKSAQVLDAFDSFFNDREGVQSAYVDMAAWLASRIAGKPGVLGLELMNEPVLIIFEPRLDDFHDRVAAAVRQEAPSLTLFFEPNSFRNLTDQYDVRRPVAFDDAVYAPHVYVDVFEDGWASRDVSKIVDSVAGIREEADAFHASPYVGEFGSGVDELGLAYDRAALEVFDDARVSSAFWVYEEWSQGGWGLYDTSVDGTRGALREPVADVLARAYPAVIDGHLESFDFDEEARTLTVHVTGWRGRPHVLAAPHRSYPNGVRVTCDGVEVDAIAQAGRVLVACPGTTIVLSPLGA